MKKKLSKISIIYFLLLVTLPVFAGCTPNKDRFWPDTEEGLLQFTNPRVTAGDEKRIVTITLIDESGEKKGIRRINHELRVGDIVTVGVFVPIVGEYREGGGWVFSGRKYFGKFGAAGYVTKASASNPEVLSVAVNQHGELLLSALSPGTSRISVSALLGRWYANRYPGADRGAFEDTAIFKVIK